MGYGWGHNGSGAYFGGDEMTHRERLQRAIDNMEKTDVCLDVFDRAMAEQRAEIEIMLQVQDNQATIIEKQRAEIKRLTVELAQANEACAALREGKPLGPVIGAQTILNQAREIERLQNEVRRAKACYESEVMKVQGQLMPEIERLQAQLETAKRGAFNATRFESAPCYLCGYNGPGYYQTEMHSCAKLYHQ